VKAILKRLNSLHLCRLPRHRGKVDLRPDEPTEACDSGGYSAPHRSAFTKSEPDPVYMYRDNGRQSPFRPSDFDADLAAVRAEARARFDTGRGRAPERPSRRSRQNPTARRLDRQGACGYQIENRLSPAI
jgi:hypothetical protein